MSRIYLLCYERTDSCRRILETFILAIFLYFANALSLPLISLSFEMAG